MAARGVTERAARELREELRNGSQGGYEKGRKRAACGLQKRRRGDLNRPPRLLIELENACISQNCPIQAGLLTRSAGTPRQLVQAGLLTRGAGTPPGSAQPLCTSFRASQALLPTADQAAPSLYAPAFAPALCASMVSAVASAFITLRRESVPTNFP